LTQGLDLNQGRTAAQQYFEALRPLIDGTKQQSTIYDRVYKGCKTDRIAYFEKWSSKSENLSINTVATTSEGVLYESKNYNDETVYQNAIKMRETTTTTIEP
jgi:hypothetical protein